MKVKLPLAKTEKKRKVPMIDHRNPEGWSKYKEESNKIASRITEAIRDTNLNIEEVRDKIEVLKLVLE